MKKLVLSLCLLTPSVLLAQEFAEQIEAVQAQIAQEELDLFVKKPSEEGLPGPFLQSLMPKKELDPTAVCEEEKDPAKKTHYEVVVIAEANSKQTDLTFKPGQERVLHTNDLKFISRYVPYSSGALGLNHEAVAERAKDLWESGMLTNLPSQKFDLGTPLGRELWMDSLVHAASNSTLSENELSRNIAGVISATFKTDEAKFQALSALSTRLYRNYNTARNPGFDNPKNNPFDAILPTGDMTINTLLNASSSYDVFNGGVCNDISEAVAQVGEHLFPDRDVLTVNSGSHFGVVISDGKTTRVIDGIIDMEMQNRLMLDPKLSSTNLRINKIENGKQRQIAVVDTEMGQVMEAAFQTGKNLLKTDADITTIMAHLKKENFGVSVGAANLSDSQVVVVVAKYEYQGDKWKSYIGAGASAERFNTDLESKYQLHFRAGAERNMFRYINSSTEVSFASGVRLGAMSALNQPKSQNGGVARLDISGQFDVYNRLDINYGKHDWDGFQVRSSVEVEHTLGPTNWGNTTGALSYMSPSDTGTILKNVTFHLNQVNANMTAEKKLTSSVTGIGTVHYQGSNIGQSVSVLAGMNVRLPEGAQLLVFTGYTNADLPGYKTKHSLLGTPTGAQVGAKYTTKGGVEFGAAVRSISGGKPSVNATIKVPIK